MNGFLTKEEFSTVLRATPLVSIDLIIRDPQGRVLLGLRSNEPAKGCYFVPGGRIRKDERMKDAFARIMKDETGLEGFIDQAHFQGIYEHFYANSIFENGDFGTHYVALAYEIKLGEKPNPSLDQQHSEYVWWTVDALMSSGRVHEFSKGYFSQESRL